MVVRFMPGSPALLFIIQGTEEIVNKTNLEMGTPAAVCLFRPPMVYYLETKMAKNHPFLWGALVLGLTLGSLSAYENRPGPAGRSAHPLFDRNGNLMIVYQNSGNGLSLAASGTAGQTNEIEAVVLASYALAPVIKKNGAGEIGIVWEQPGFGKDEITFGRIKDNRLLSAQTVVHSAFPLLSPDLDFDQELNPWIAWVQCVNERYYVCVANLNQNKVWIVNGPYFTSALSPKVLAGSSQGIWVFWTGRDGGRDEIFGSIFQGEAWSKPYNLNKDNRFPHLSPSAGLDGNGCPWVAWSAYDGLDYEIFCSSWNGTAWSAEEKLTDNMAADTSPAIAFVYGTTPLVIWSRSFDRTGALFARYKQGQVWGSEIEIVSGQAHPVRSPKVAVLGERIGLAWESGEQIGTLVISFKDLIQSSAPAVQPHGPPPIFNPDLDENQYVGFGDSITYAENQGYIPRLEPLLAQKYGAAKIWNEGYGGETTLEGLTRIEAVITAHQARYLLLMEGTNDVIFLEISMETAAFDLEEMARRCLKAGMFPLIATIIPRKDWRWFVAPYQSRISELNSRIRRLAETLKIPMVDQFDVFYNYPASEGGWQSLLRPDGVHPNPKGFQVMAETWFGGIEILPFPPVEVRVARSANKILFYSQPGNLLRWQSSLKAEPSQIAAFKIYRKEQDGSETSFQLVATIPFLTNALTYKYFDAKIAPSKKYSYIISTLRKDGIEGPGSGMVNDKF